MTVRTSGEPPVLLHMPGYHGTLAAVRCLGAAGIRVTVADGDPFVPAAWSRFVARHVRCPSPENPSRFIRWLLEFGAREPGHVLCSTSDDVAWLYATHRDELRRDFLVPRPDVEVIYCLLNKMRLRAAAEPVGLQMPRTWVPAGESDFAEIEATARFPVVIKPQTQILFHPHAKGVPVHRRQQLRSSYAAFASATRYADCLLTYDPGVSRAMVQEFFPACSENVYGISGFVDSTGELFAARASRKILQQPRALGVGLCFEEEESRPDLLSKIVALCKSVGYDGVFEAEFIESEGASFLIDFNPRFYGQMAFDIARGLPLPLLAYDSAIGRRERLQERILAAAEFDRPRGHVYCRRFELKLRLGLRRLFGRMSNEEWERWRGWLAQHRPSMVDAVFDPRDRLPSWLERVHHVSRHARHPRSFVRQVITD